jgi:hypothetical protein
MAISRLLELLLPSYNLSEGTNETTEEEGIGRTEPSI